MRRVRRLGLAAAVPLLWATLAVGAPASDPRAVIDELMTASGLKQQILRASDQGHLMLLALGQAVGARRMERLRAVAAETYDSATLLRRTAETLHAQYDERRTPAALEALRSPTVRVITDLGLIDPPVRDVEVLARRGGASVARREMIASIDEAAGMSRMQVGLATVILRGRIRGYSSDQLPSFRPTPQQIEQRLSESRPELESRMVSATHARLRYAFREATDAELQEYLAFLGSEPGVWLVRVTHHVAEQVVGVSLERFQFETIRTFSFQKRLVLD